MSAAYRELVDTFGSGWEQGNVDTICSVFTEDAVFLETPFSQPDTGIVAIRPYWRDIPLTQAEVLLDLGGSTGVVAEKLAKDFNLDGTVVEPAPAEADRARARGLAVAAVSLEEYEAGGNHYDLVTLCQTVDHLLDIKGALSRIRKLLAPGGLFFVDFVEDGPVKIDHPYYLTRKTMERYLDGAGFRVEKLEKAADGLHVNVLAEGA